MGDRDAIEFSVAGEEPDAGAFAWSPDGSKIAVLGRLFRYAAVYDVESGKRLAQIEDLATGGRSVGFDPNGRVILPPRGPGGAAVTLWDPERGQIWDVPGPEGPESSPIANRFLSFSLDRKNSRLYGIHQAHTRNGPVPQIAAFDTERWKLLARIDGPASEVASAPGGDRAAFVDRHGGVTIVEVASGLTVASIPAAGPRVRILAWGPDGHLLATGKAARRSEGGAAGSPPLQLWRSADGAHIASVGPDIGRVLSLDFGPDGRELVSTSSQGGVSLWDAHTLEPVGQVEAPNASSETLARFSPDGKRLAVLDIANARVRVYAMHSQK